MKTTKRPKETTIRIEVEIRNKLKDFANKKGLRLSSMLTRGLSNALEKHPDIFLPSHEQ